MAILDLKKIYQEHWVNLDAAAKKKTVMIIILASVMVFGAAIYFIKFGSKNREATPGNKNPRQEIKLEPHLLEKSAYLQGQEKINSMLRDVEEMKKELKDANNQKEQPVKTNLAETYPGMKRPTEGAPQINKSEPLPPPPLPRVQSQQYSNNSASRSGLPMPPIPGGQRLQEEPPAEREIGAIEIATNHSSADSKEKSAEKKSKKKTVYLPPSFMEATMLSGLDAPTTEGGKGEPVPVLLRINDLAFLPNQVRANLKGCFIISEGHGSLADERAHLRITNISCLSKKGTAVIDQHVKGFVVDSDGKIGLRGRVVSKMGSIVARSVIAGFFGGIGDAIKAQTTSVSVSPLGQTQTIDPNQVVQAGIGSGISTATQQISKFYLELARQAMPVIEVGAVRDVTLVISEGTELEIKEINKGEDLP